jgi:mRNA-degrading endonuclease toxin of MazEF toxin-antitoxin module
MTLRPGEVILIRIDFHQSPGGKLRPAAVLLDSDDDDFVAAPITSRLRASAFDVAIQQWRKAGLNTASTIRVHKLTVLAKDEVVRRLGELAEPDRAALRAVLRRAFSLDQQDTARPWAPAPQNFPE